MQPRRSGRAPATHAPYARRRAPRTLGLFDGQPFGMADDFEALPDDIAVAFEGDDR